MVEANKPDGIVSAMVEAGQPRNVLPVTIVTRPANATRNCGGGVLTRLADHQKADTQIMKTAKAPAGY